MKKRSMIFADLASCIFEVTHHLLELNGSDPNIGSMLVIHVTGKDADIASLGTHIASQLLEQKVIGEHIGPVASIHTNSKADLSMVFVDAKKQHIAYEEKPHQENTISPNDLFERSGVFLVAHPRSSQNIIFKYEKKSGNTTLSIKPHIKISIEHKKDMDSAAAQIVRIKAGRLPKPLRKDFKACVRARGVEISG